MALEFDIQGPGGNEKAVPIDSLVEMLTQDGEQVLNVSPDGMMIQVAGMNGPINVPTQQAWQSYGLQVSGLKPTQADYSQVSPAHRNAITAIEDEDLKKVYLEGALKKQGIKSPQIVGSGRDYFYFDPQFGKYIALTNNPDWDASDIQEFAAAGPRVAGSILGGALGAGAGPVGIGAGAAIGGALGSSASKALSGYFNPEAGQVMSENLPTMGKQVGIDAVVDAATAGIGSKVPGLLSGAAKTGGRVLEAGGGLLNKAAKFVDKTPWLKNIASTFIPGAAEWTTAGLLGQIPGQAIRGAARGVGGIGESKFMQSLAPDVASRMKTLSQQLLRRSGGTAPGMAEEIAGKIAGKAPGARSVGTAEDVLGNLGELLSGRTSSRHGIADLYKAGRNIGQSRRDALEGAKAMYAEKTAASQKMGDIGRAVGRGVQTVEDASRGLESAGNAVASGLLKGARATGYVTGKLGQAVKAGGTVAAPVENRLLGRYGAEEAYDYMKPKRPWQMTENPDTMKSVWASSY